MKEVTFLKERLIAYKGIYDNKNIYENTLESFTASIMKNFSIYFSVKCTKDNVLVVYHDDNLARIMNLKDKISETTYEELNYICLYHIPTLEEALNLINGQVPIIISLKSRDNKYAIEKELSKVLDRYQGLFGIVSADPLIIKWFNKNKPDYIIGEIISKIKRFHKMSLKSILANYSIVSDFKSINIEDYDLYKIKEVKETSLTLGYLINTQEKYKLFKDTCDNIIMDGISELDV